MNTQYFKNHLSLKQQAKLAYQSHLHKIQLLFSQLQTDHQNNTCIKFEAELRALKDVRNFKNKDFQQIYKYFVDRNISDFYFLRESNSIQLKILRLTKCQLQNYNLDWKQVWNKLLLNEPELSTMKLYHELLDFLKNIRHLYDPNNAIEVLDYFISKHSLYTDNIYLFISLFANLSHKTTGETFKKYVERLFELYQVNQLKASNLLIMFINASKYKHFEVTQQVFKELTNIIVYSVTTPSSEKKDSIQSKFNTRTANIVIKILGQSNEESIHLLELIFQIIKNFIRPFEDSKKPLKFLYLIVTGIIKRVETQKACEKKLEQLRAKQKKKQQKQALQLKLQNEQSTITEAYESQAEVKPNKPQNQPSKPKEQQQESQEQEQDQNDSEEQQQDKKLDKMISMELDIEENQNQKTNSIQTKIEKLEAALKNKITEEILSTLKTFITQKFEDLFYVNSKKIVNKLLKELFKIYPQFITKSFETLEKAGNIPQINEQGLIGNIKHIAKYLFCKQVRTTPDFLDYVFKILNRVQQNRKITDVWEVINIFVQKIPLLDEGDMQKVPEQQKCQFEKQFGQPHDKFYQTYSEIIFQSLKRLFTQSQHYDNSTSITIDKYIIDLLLNSYPFFKKRVLREIQEQVLENNNKFLLAIFHSNIRPSKQFQDELRELIDNRNIESLQNLQLDINVNIILGTDMNIGNIKKLIRKYSKKNNYKFLKQCLLYLTNYNLIIDPLKSDLGYFEKKPALSLVQEPSLAHISGKLKEVYDYSLQLLDELVEELKQFQSRPLLSLPYESIITKLYTSKEMDFKNMKVQKRKNINEMLQILKNILQNLFHQLQEYNAQKNTFAYRQSPYKRQSFIKNDKFKQILSILTYNQIFLHDHNIMQNLSAILQNEIFFMYRSQIRLQKQILNKYTKRNQRQQLPGQSNLTYINNIYITKARIVHFSLLMNKYRDSVSIETIQNELRILLIAPGNEKSNVINKILVKKTTCIDLEAEKLIKLLENTFQSRFFYEKVLSLLNDFNTAGYRYSHEQSVQLIDLHIPLLQSQNIKIREYSLKSFQKFIKTFSKANVFGQVENTLRKYIQRQKLELIWIISVIIVLKEPKRSTPLDQYLQNILEYLRELSKLIQSQTRIIRRISLFVYSYCFKKAKKAVKIYEEIKVEEQKYAKSKTIQQLFEQGYIREEHKQIDNFSNKNMLKKTAPYTSFLVKKKCPNLIFQQIENQSFQFILSNPELGVKMLKQFHIDMAGSVEQVLSMMSNKKHDLGEITMKLLQGCYLYTKLKKLNFERIEYYFGQRFYRYLFAKDASSNQFKFFLQSKEVIQELLSNIQAYDNQTLINIYVMDVLIAYQKNYKKLNEETRVEVQKFLLRIIGQIIYKGSGVLYKKLLLMIAKVEDIQSVKFLVTYFQNLLKNHQKTSRVSQILFTLYEDDYSKFMTIIEFIFNEKLELNNNYINTLVSIIVSLPEKYILTQKVINKYAIIDRDAELKDNQLQVFKDHIYLLSTHQFNKLLVNKLSQFFKEALKLESNHTSEGQNLVKSKNELVKIIYNITTSSINALIQFYQTEEVMTALIDLITLLFRLFQFKMDLYVDFKQLEDTIKCIFSNKFEEIGHFQHILSIIMDNLNKIPNKKQADLIKIISSRPGNFYFISKQNYKKFIVKVLRLQQNPIIYRDLLVSLSTLLAYVPLTWDQINDESEPLSKNQSILFLQSHILSTMDISSPLVEKILKQSSKDKRNIFCKQILVARGKKQYLDDELKYRQWKEIKQYSNPYHYHA